MSNAKSSSALPRERLQWLQSWRHFADTVGWRTAWPLAALARRTGLLHEETKTYYVLSRNPIVIYIGNVMRNLLDVSELLRDRRVVYVRNGYHQFETDERLAQLREEHRYHQSQFPHHAVCFMCATPKEFRRFGEYGLTPRFFCNKNCLVDETLYRIDRSVEKEFDAVHNGQLAAYKRHELAEKVDNLALIVYRHSVLSKRDAYTEDIRRRLAHATWLNDLDARIEPKEIYKYLNRARVGLCLSEEEGPMAASVEYMLCGLPIVSTHSIGGREVFFDDEYVRLVDDDPEAVRDGVKEMIARDIAPERIRARTLERMRIHREHFIAKVQRIIDEEGGGACFRRDFERFFVNKLRVSSAFPSALYRYLVKGMPGELVRSMVARSTQ